MVSLAYQGYMHLMGDRVTESQINPLLLTRGTKLPHNCRQAALKQVYLTQIFSA